MGKMSENGKTITVSIDGVLYKVKDCFIQSEKSTYTLFELIEVIKMSSINNQPSGQKDTPELTSQ